MPERAPDVAVSPEKVRSPEEALAESIDDFARILFSGELFDAASDSDKEFMRSIAKRKVADLASFALNTYAGKNMLGECEFSARANGIVARKLLIHLFDASHNTDNKQLSW